MVSLLKDKNFIGFVVKFLLLFAALYYGTLLIIGLSAPDDYYIPFVAKYLDYITQLKWGLMKSTKFFLSLFGIETYFAPNFSIKIVEGRGVRIAMSCVGYGVYSFWIAFVLASAGKILAKLLWVMGGLLLLWTINVVRIALFLLADTKYEFGLLDEKIVLMDEIHTPDSSRYFYANGFEERQQKGEKQHQLSKEFVREWLMANNFMGKEGQHVPEMTDEWIHSISCRYIELYEKITGQQFVPQPLGDGETYELITNALNRY